MLKAPGPLTFAQASTVQRGAWPSARWALPPAGSRARATTAWPSAPDQAAKSWVDCQPPRLDKARPGCSLRRERITASNAALSLAAPSSSSRTSGVTNSGCTRPFGRLLLIAAAFPSDCRASGAPDAFASGASDLAAGLRRLALGRADGSVMIGVELVEDCEARRAIFVEADLAVLVLVELGERRRAVGGGRRALRRGGHELGLAQLSVVVGVELGELAVEARAHLRRAALQHLELGSADLSSAERSVAVGVDRLERGVELPGERDAGRRLLRRLLGRSRRLWRGRRSNGGRKRRAGGHDRDGC